MHYGIGFFNLQATKIRINRTAVPANTDVLETLSVHNFVNKCNILIFSRFKMSFIYAAQVIRFTVKFKSINHSYSTTQN